MEEQKTAFFCNPGVLQTLCSQIAAFLHHLTFIYCTRKNGAINCEPASVGVYFCQAPSAGAHFVTLHSQRCAACLFVALGWGGGQLRDEQRLSFGGSQVFLVRSALTCGNEHALVYRPAAVATQIIHIPRIFLANILNNPFTFSIYFQVY